MRPRERFPHDDPREWLNRARSNLARARQRIPGTYLEDACFDAQQAAEKAVKGLLLGTFLLRSNAGHFYSGLTRTCGIGRPGPNLTDSHGLCRAFGDAGSHRPN